MLEVNGMTHKEELELLMQEQQADDTPRIIPQENTVSLSIGDLVGVDEEGAVISFFKPSNDHAFMTGGTPHGTIYAYRRLKCKCDACKAAQAKSVREYRAARKQAA